MAFRISTGIANHILQHGALRDALQNGTISYYSGSQPSSADAAPTGTKLVTFTRAGAAHTAEVVASGTVTLAGASGSVDDITVDGISIIDNAVPFTSTLGETATALALEINRSLSSPDYRATAASAVVTILAKRGAGASPNTFVVGGTLTTLTATYVDLASGVTPVNGLRLVDAAAGKLLKDSGQTWQGTAVAGGTAGWFRFVGSVADSAALDSSESQIRIDGNIGTSGADLTISNPTITNAAVQNLTAFEIEMPRS